MSKLLVLTLFLAFVSTIQITEANYGDCTSDSSKADSKILTSLNGQLQGSCVSVPVRDHKKNVTYSDVFTWMSVPFAEAPVGENRFMNPKPIKSWDNVLDATQKPVACMQRSNPNQQVAEDCLYLNVFVRADSYLNRKNSLKPILLWIHGGGYVSGSGASTDGYTLAALKDVIVVSINYRLGPFGFMYMPDTDATGNQGFLDQHMAMQWVHDNADRFGGDRDRITISGTSAGAAFVNFHLYYKPSWPLFRSGILQSSGVEGPNSVNLLLSSTDATSRAEQLIDSLGCQATSTDQRLECAQKEDATLIIEKSRDIKFNRLVLDNIVWTKYIDELSAAKEKKKCNIITGFTSDEIHFPDTLPYDRPDFFTDLIKKRLADIVHAPLPANHVALILQEYFNTSDVSTVADFNYPLAGTRILSDAMFVCANFKTAESYNSNVKGQKSWVYEFKYKNKQSDLPDYYYAPHGSEAKFVFAQPLALKWPNQPFNWQDAYFDQKFLNYWANFLYNDDVNVRHDTKVWSPWWKKFNLKKERYLELKNFGIEMKNGYESHHCDFWNNVIQ